MPKVTLKQSLENHKKLEEYKKEERERRKLMKNLKKEKSDVMLALCNFRCFMFDPFFAKFKREGIKLLYDYASSVKKQENYFNEKTVKYAENLIKFINSFKNSSKVDIQAGVELSENPYEWECFCLGSLAKAHKEHLFC